MKEKTIQFKDIVKNQLPQYVREDYPLIGEFLSQYYLSQEFQGAPVDLIQNIDDYLKVDIITNLTESTILGSDISEIDSEINIDLLNSEKGTDGFPEKYGLILIDSELIVYESKSFGAFHNCYRGFSGILSHKNTNVGIASTYKLQSSDQLVFNDSESNSHKQGTSIYNLSSLFLKEFLTKTKYQLTPGFENRSFVDKVNEATIIKQIKDFYRSKGTDRSFEILFKALYGENVQVIRPKNYLFRPSDAQYKITNDLVVEKISGPIEEISNLTLFQDSYLNIPKSYGPVTNVENISSNDGRTFYKLQIDGGYNRDTIVDGAIYGRFSVHAKTKVIGKFLKNSISLDVDSTVGFPNKGELSIIFNDGTSGVISYESKNITQFLGCTGITEDIEDGTQVSINTYAYAVTESGEKIKVRINSILSDVDIPPNTHYYSKDDTATIKTLGYNTDQSNLNDWIFNVSPTYEVKSIELVDFADNTYFVLLEDRHTFRFGDNLQVIDNTNNIKNSTVIDVPEEKAIIISGQGYLNLEINSYKIKRNLLKVNSKKYSSSNSLVANIQNIYKDIDTSDIIVASSSIPYYPNQTLDASDRSVSFSGAFVGSNFTITTLIDHGFYTGDSVYYTPEKTTETIFDADGNSATNEVVSSSLFDEGVYFIKRIDSNTVKFAKSRSDILNQKFITLSSEINVQNNKLQPYEFFGKELQSQKLLRKISTPIPTNNPIKTNYGFTGILVNGVEILNYKSKDKIIYGPIESVDVISNGSGYDIIFPPQLIIKDSIGIGATGYCAVSGSLQEVRLLDSGFDYQEIPSIKITGGNGFGAEAKANMRLISHEVYFNSELSSLVGLGATLSTIGFSTSHKFKNGEEVVYNTHSQKSISGLSTYSNYYLSVVSPTKVKLHKTLNDALSGINTIQLNSYGKGNHSLESTNKKSVLASVTVVNPGSGYQNKKRTVSSSGINTSSDTINISNHDFNSGEIVTYSTTGSPIGGLTNNTNYYITKVDNNSFKLSNISTNGYPQNYYYITKQFVDITTKNSDLHVFNYPEINVEIIGNVGVSSEYKAKIQPIFRGEIASIHLSSNGSSYGVEDVLNIDRQPLFEIVNGSGAEFLPVISNGNIKQVLIQNEGKDYTSPPNLIVDGVGRGAVLVPIISNNKIVEVKVVNGGEGYSTDSTNIIAISSGSGAQFRANIKNWTVNLFQKYNNQYTSDDGVISNGLNTEYELQYAHLYAPRKLRELLYSKDQSGKILYSNPDLKIINNVESSSLDHSPIIGWSYDGHPIYGPYGYSTKSGGAVTQMKSGYKLSLDSTRPSLSYFPEGFFVEDFKYFNVDDETVLDENNGRFCITPEFPNGVYAYFSTIEKSSIESSGPFVGYKKPVFPYLIGNFYKSKPNQFNFERTSNQDEINFNETNWIRNTYPYNIAKNKSTYEYITIPNNLNQLIDISAVTPGSIDDIKILSGGKDYQINDSVVFDNVDSSGKIKGNAASAVVSSLVGKSISSISVATTSLYNVEIYPLRNKGDYIVYNNSPHKFTNFDLVSITGLSTSSSLIEGNYIAGIETSKFVLVGSGTTTIGISSSSATGIVTFISVKGIDFSSIRENDIYTIDNERIKVLNVDQKSSRLRILREIDGTVGVSHTATSILYEDPRKLIVKSGIVTDYVFNQNKEIYFNPKESLALGTNSAIGIGTTITFSNPGAGLTQVFVPLRSIYLPGHQLKTGDILTYKTNGGSPITVSSTGIGFTTLQNNSTLYVAKINEDIIGISTVQVGLGSTGFFNGISNSTKNIGLLYFVGTGSGDYHSFETNYSVLTGQISKNIVTVSTAQTHGLNSYDFVDIDVNPGITTTIVVKYDDYNRRLIINPKNFTSLDVDVNMNSIKIVNHGFFNGQKVIHTSSSPSAGLLNSKIYYVVVVDQDTIRLSDTYFNSKNKIPNIINITSSSLGTLCPVNPPIKVYKNSTIIFDLSDQSLSYINQFVRYSAFKFELYKDSNFRDIFDSTEISKVFNVQRSGVTGVSADAKVVLFIDDYFPQTLYYRLVPILDGNPPIEKTEIIVDDLVDSNNEIQINYSIYNGNHTISYASSTSFNYFLPKIPEASSYTSESSDLKYYTNSPTAYGEVKKIKITNKGVNYYSLPAISTVTSRYGNGCILEPQSNSIGSIKKTKITNVGFDFPCDYTLKPNISLPKIVKIDRLSSLERIDVISFGRGYTSAPKLLVFDGKTKDLIPEIDLKYQLGETNVEIKNNTYGISDITPIIIPTENSNGVGIRTISYNASNKKVTVGLSTGFATLDSFPFKVNDKVLIENISVGIATTAKGFNSKDYDYELFTITEITPNIGGIGSVTYSLDGYLQSYEFPGVFNPQNSSGRIIPEKFFPTFSIVLKKNEYKKGEFVKSGNSSGIVENWDSETNYLRISTKNIFEVGNKIEGLSSKTQGIASSITDFDCYATLAPISRFESGWQINAGFLNDELQRIQDNFYYQNFSYSLKSKIDYDTWDDAVSSLNHTVGFKKFADYQLESRITTTNNDQSLVVGLSTQNTSVDVVADIIGYADLNCFNDFDLAKENSITIDSRIVSNRIFFKNRILTDYYESIGNRVLSIDDFSNEFNSSPRTTEYSEVSRFDITSIRAKRYLTFVRDRRYYNHRQAMIVTLLHDDYNGYINQYGRVETNYDMGSFDFTIDGSEGVLNYYPTKYSINDYEISTISHSVKDNLVGIASTSIGQSVRLVSNNTSVTTSSPTNIVSFASTYSSAKILVELTGNNGEYEFNELNLVHDGSNIELLEYGQLSTKSVLPQSVSGYGTYYPYFSGSNLKIDFIRDSQISESLEVNTTQILIKDSSEVGIGTFDMKHARLESRVTNILSSPTPTEVPILEYSGEYKCAYCLVQVFDSTNNSYQLSEVVLVNDDLTSDAYLTEFANIETQSSAGTIGCSVTGVGQTTRLTFTPLPDIDTQVKVYANILRLQDDARNIVNFNDKAIETSYGTYYGTEKDLRRSFELKHKSYPIFERYFSGVTTSVVNVDQDTIEIPGHFFVTGEKVTYSYGEGETPAPIGIATTTISGIGNTNKLPSEVYIVKVNENRVKLAASAQDALKSIPKTLDLTSVGIGSTHTLTSRNQNSRVIISLDNIIQSPIVSTSQTTTLSINAYSNDDVLYFAGITSFFGGDLVKIGNEIMKIESVGVGSTNSVKVRRPWLGTVVAGYSTGSLVTKVVGNYNIVGNVINFVESPYGNVLISSTTNPPSERDWDYISSGSKFSGRTFMRSGIVNSSNEPYYKNYIFDDISNNFNGKQRTFTLKSSGSNISGISNENAIVLINDVFQGPGTGVDYTLLESSGITSVRFTGTASSVSYDINTSNLPVGGVIVSVGSTEGFGYQPLVSAGGTAIVSGLGTISSVSIANSGSGYRSGLQTVRVGVQTSDLNGFYIKFIGTANVNKGNVVSIAITNPGFGYTSSNPPQVIIDAPLSYSDIPLVYSSSSVGLGTGATIDIVVGQGSSVINFEIKNTGYDYREGQILTVATGGSTGIPTTSSFKEFKLTIQKVASDKFTGWSVGELQTLDDISDLFDGETTTFPLTVSGNLVSIKSAKGSNINVQDLLLVFINDILQVPGEGYTFDGGSIITFTEAPKGPSLDIAGTNDKCKILFYKGSGSVDVVERNILETVKVGDGLTFGYDSTINQPSTLQEEERTVTSILTTDLVTTNPYFGPGNTNDESLLRTITWCRQTEDKIIDEQEIAKDRMLYEPVINPIAYLIQPVGVNTTILYVDNVRPFFDQINESNTSLNFQKEITLISQDTKISAAATAVVSSAGTISSIIVNNGGSGYNLVPNVFVQSPTGIVTITSTATASITSGVVDSISITGIVTGYSKEDPPAILIESPTVLTETNKVSSYSGDSGVIVGFGTTTIGAANLAIFDFLIPKDSVLRDSSIVGTAITISGISTGDFFAIYDSNVGSATTNFVTIGVNNLKIGTVKQNFDGIYQVRSVENILSNVSGIGVTYVRRVLSFISGIGTINFSSSSIKFDSSFFKFDSTGIGSATATYPGTIYTSSYFGNYSWGKIELESRSKNYEFNVYNDNGFVGIKTSSLVKRTSSLKYTNYLV